MSAERERRDDFNTWLGGEILLIGLLGATLALFLVYQDLHTSYDLPRLRLVLQTAMALAGGLVALLAGVRFSVGARRPDPLLCPGFPVRGVSPPAFWFGPPPAGKRLRGPRAWGGVIGGAL